MNRIHHNEPGAEIINDFYRKAGLDFKTHSLKFIVDTRNGMITIEPFKAPILTQSQLENVVNSPECRTRTN
jgi:hypothetical protein